MQQIWEDGTPMTVSDEFAEKVRDQAREIAVNKRRIKDEHHA